MVGSALETRTGPDGTIRNADFDELLARHGLCDFDSLMQRSDGDVIKHAVARRKTVRLSFAGGTAIYLKRHFPAGFFAGLGSLIKFSPEPTAFDEFENIVAFHHSGLPTVIPLSAGRRAAGLLQTESFLATLALQNCTKLDQYVSGPLSFQARQELLRQAALLVRKMHDAGFNHRDLYLCHILRDGEGKLYIVDLHRVQRRAAVPERWLVKDIAALNYSARSAGVSRSDRLRFLKLYLDVSRLTGRDRRFALKVLKKTRKMIEHNNRTAAACDKIQL